MQDVCEAVSPPPAAAAVNHNVSRQFALGIFWLENTYISVFSISSMDILFYTECLQ